MTPAHRASAPPRLRQGVLFHDKCGAFGVVAHGATLTPLLPRLEGGVAPPQGGVGVGETKNHQPTTSLTTRCLPPSVLDEAPSPPSPGPQSTEAIGANHKGTNHYRDNHQRRSVTKRVGIVLSPRRGESGVAGRGESGVAGRGALPESLEKAPPPPLRGTSPSGGGDERNRGLRLKGKEEDRVRYMSTVSHPNRY